MLIVSIINYLIELYDGSKYPVDVCGIGVTEDGEILSANGDNL